MAKFLLNFHILLLIPSQQGWRNTLAKYEKLRKYWSYCTLNFAITNIYLRCYSYFPAFGYKFKHSALLYLHMD